MNDDEMDEVLRQNGMRRARSTNRKSAVLPPDAGTPLETLQAKVGVVARKAARGAAPDDLRMVAVEAHDKRRRMVIVSNRRRTIVGEHG